MESPRIPMNARLALVLSLRDGGILPEKEIDRILGLAMTAAELEGFDEDAPASKAAEETIRGLAAVLLNDDDED